MWHLYNMYIFAPSENKPPELFQVFGPGWSLRRNQPGRLFCGTRQHPENLHRHSWQVLTPKILLNILWKLFWNDIENLHKTYWKPFHQVFQALWDEQQLWVLESPVGWNTVSPALKRLSTCEYTQHTSKGFSSMAFYQDCESFAGAVTVKDCTEGPDSCYAYVEDDCVYTGERVGELWKG